MNRPNGPPRGRRGELIIGRLEGHGRANYQFEPDGSSSYYVKLVTARGLETLWGTDLERAVARSTSELKIGARVGARRSGSEPVIIPAKMGERTPDRQRTFHRALWEVESVSHFAQSAQQAKREVKAQLEDRREMAGRPELRSAYISLQVAEKYAEQFIRDARDRQLFIDRIKDVMAASVASGRTLPKVRMLEGREDRAPPRSREDPVR